MSVWDEGAWLAKKFADAVREGRDEEASIIATALIDLPHPADYEDGDDVPASRQG